MLIAGLVFSPAFSQHPVIYHLVDSTGKTIYKGEGDSVNFATAPQDVIWGFKVFDPNIVVRERHIDNRDPAMKYYGNWTHSSEPDEENPNRCSCSWAKNIGDSVTYTFNRMTRVEVHSEYRTHLGKYAIYLNGEFQAEIDHYSDPEKPPLQLHWAKDSLDYNQTYTIRLQSLQTKNPNATGTNFTVFELRTFNDSDIDPPPYPTPPDLPVQWQVNALHPNIKYSPNWKASSDQSYMTSQTKGDTLWYEFDSTNFIGIHMRMGNSKGQWDLWLDGVYQGLQDNYSPTWNEKGEAWISDSLDLGQHQIMIVSTGTRNQLSTNQNVNLMYFNHQADEAKPEEPIDPDPDCERTYVNGMWITASQCTEDNDHLNIFDNDVYSYWHTMDTAWVQLEMMDYTWVTDVGFNVPSDDTLSHFYEIWLSYDAVSWHTIRIDSGFTTPSLAFTHYISDLDSLQAKFIRLVGKGISLYDQESSEQVSVPQTWLSEVNVQTRGYYKECDVCPEIPDCPDCPDCPPEGVQTKLISVDQYVIRVNGSQIGSFDDYETAINHAQKAKRSDPDAEVFVDQIKNSVIID